MKWNRIKVPTIIIGEYSFSENPWLQLSRPLVFLPSYCSIGKKRRLPSHQLAKFDYIQAPINNYDNVRVYPNGHSVHINESSNYLSQSTGHVEVRKICFYGIV